MRKLDGANGTKAHLKKQKSAETRDRRKTTKRRTKNLQTKAPTKVRYSRSTQKRKKSSSRVEEGSYLFLFPAQIFLSKSARTPKAVKVCFWSLESIIFGISLLLALSWS
jgi:hypothetical protein